MRCHDACAQPPGHADREGAGEHHHCVQVLRVRAARGHHRPQCEFSRYVHTDNTDISRLSPELALFYQSVVSEIFDCLDIF